MAFRNAKSKYRAALRERGFSQCKDERLQQAKARSYCSVCHKKGHWHKDPECPANKGRQGAETHTTHVIEPVKFKYLWIGRSRFEKHLKPALEIDLGHCDQAPSSDVTESDLAMEDEQTRADRDPGGLGDPSPPRVDCARAAFDTVRAEGEANRIGAQWPLQLEAGPVDPEVQGPQRQDPGEADQRTPDEVDQGRGACQAHGDSAIRSLSRVPILRSAYELFGLGHRGVSQQRESLPGPGQACSLGEGEQGHGSQRETEHRVQMGDAQPRKHTSTSKPRRAYNEPSTGDQGFNMGTSPRASMSTSTGL